MQDIVRILKNHADANNWVFSYGRRSNLNLLESSDVQEDIVHLLTEPPRRRFNPNTNRTTYESVTVKGSLFLMLKSEFDMPYFNEVGNPDTRSKFTNYIEPLMQHAATLYNAISRCSDTVDVELWECIDAVNLFDENRDGVLITYQIKIQRL